ncbi:14339_t:CDS:2 [Acaulospora colombiana]|uniref:14339_t:CDS:1 n=1 Tax=Acaulospora colombiana TaxID=27376 RepID=A0ACA9JVI2_9GLOM|nr:14339_t:CDS:2 [Acaulospora colombiana]
MGAKINFREFLSPTPREQFSSESAARGAGHEDSRPLQVSNTVTIRRSDTLPKSKLDRMRNEVKQLIQEGTRPVYGAIKIISWIDENLKCLEHQGIRLIQRESTGSYHLMDRIERKKAILRVEHEERVNERKRYRARRNQESSWGGFTSSRVRSVWNGGYIEVERPQNEIIDLLDFYQNQLEIVTIDMEDEKEDVISIYASDPEFDDLEGEEREKDVESEDNSRVGELAFHRTYKVLDSRWKTVDLRNGR